MTRGSLGCCKCGSYEHHSHECAQPMGAEYIPEPVFHTEDAGETWMGFTLFYPAGDKCFTRTLQPLLSPLP